MKRMNAGGYYWSRKVEGRTYYIEDQCFVLTRDGSVYHDDHESEPQPATEEMAARVHAAVQEDEQEARDRRAYAEGASKGNKVLQEILIMGAYYRDCEPPIQTFEAHPGISFVTVGHNSTHEFLAGASEDGRRFYLSLDCERYSESSGRDGSFCKELERWDEMSYWGHC